MAQIFRVKRRNDDEPLDALFFACKKRKTGSEEDSNAETSDSFKKVAKFVASIKDPDANVFEHITKTISKEELQSNYKQHIPNIADKIRKETKQASAESRFKVVNQFRSLNDSNTVDSDVKEVTVIDIEDTVSCSEKKENPDDQTDYVYDLYYTNNEPGDLFVELMHMDIFMPNEEHLFNSDHDSEDSNSESHWKNDYPDSDNSDNSIQAEDMVNAVEKLKLAGDDSDLSSEDEHYGLGVTDDDVDLFGSVYKKWKANCRKHFDGEETDSDANSNDSEEIKNEDYPDD